MANFLWDYINSKLQGYLEGAFSKIMYGEWATSLAYYVTKLAAIVVVVGVVSIMLISAILSIAHVFSYAFLYMGTGAIGSVLATVLALFSSAEKAVIGTSVVEKMQEGVQYAKGAAKQWHTGFMDEYDPLCKDINSAYYKNNEHCKKYKEADTKLYDKMLNDEINLKDQNTGFLNRKRWTTKDSLIVNPRGSTLQEIGGLCGENCMLGKKLVVELFSKYYSKALNSTEIITENSLNVMLEKYKDSKLLYDKDISILTWIKELVKNVFTLGGSTDITLGVDDLQKLIYKYIDKNKLALTLYNADLELNTIYSGEYAENIKRVSKDVITRLCNFLALALKNYKSDTNIKVKIDKTSQIRLKAQIAKEQENNIKTTQEYYEDPKNPLFINNIGTLENINRYLSDEGKNSEYNDFCKFYKNPLYYNSDLKIYIEKSSELANNAVDSLIHHEGITCYPDTLSNLNNSISFEVLILDYIKSGKKIEGRRFNRVIDNIAYKMKNAIRTMKDATNRKDKSNLLALAEEKKLNKDLITIVEKYIEQIWRIIDIVVEKEITEQVIIILK